MPTRVFRHFRLLTAMALALCLGAPNAALAKPSLEKLQKAFRRNCGTNLISHSSIDEQMIRWVRSVTEVPSPSPAGCLQTFLDAGADPNDADPVEDVSILSELVLAERTDLVKVLLADPRTSPALLKGAYEKEGPLARALEADRTEIFKLLLGDKRSDVNGSTYLGSLLSMAVHRENLEAVKAILARKDLLVNQGAMTDSTPPLFAALRRVQFSNGGSNDAKQILELLLQRKDLNIAIKNASGETALHLAAQTGNPNLVKRLLSLHPFDLNAQTLDRNTPLFYAVQSRNKKMVEYLLSLPGLKPDLRASNGYTPLQAAILGGDLEVAELLSRQKGINLQTKDDSGEDLLSSAVSTGHTDTLKFVLSLPNMDPCQVSSSGNTLLHRVMARSKTSFFESDFVETLISACPANLNQKNSTGKTPLMEALDLSRYEELRIAFYAEQYRSFYELINLLASQKGIDLNETNPNGESALMYALDIHAPKETIQIFLQNQANPNAKNKDGLTPLSVAIGSNDIRGIDLLLQYQADPKVLTAWGANLLMIAVEFADRDVVELVLSQGLSPHTKDLGGRNALWYAAKGSKWETLEFLLSLKGVKESELWEKDTSGVSAAALLAKVHGNPELSPRLAQIAEEAFLRGRFERFLDPTAKEGSNLSDAIRYLAYLALQHKPLPNLPKSAPKELQIAAAKLQIALHSSWDLRPEDLFVVENPPAEYLTILLKASHTREAREGQKFKPTRDQVQKVLRMVFDAKVGTLSDDELEEVAKLLSSSGVAFSADLLSKIKIDPKKLKEDVKKMIEIKPFEYRGFPELAALKLYKAFETADNTRCEQNMQDDGRSTFQDPTLRDLIQWFYIYGDQTGVDRALFSKVAMLMYESGKLCDLEKSMILKSLHNWRKGVEGAQIGLLCAAGNELASRPLSTLPFSDFMTISQAIGSLEELTSPEFLEQASVAGNLHQESLGQPPKEEEQLLKDSLYSYVLGRPAGKATLNLFNIQTLQFQTRDMPERKAHPGSIVQLCRVLLSKKNRKDATAEKTDEKFIAGAQSWIDEMKTNLDSKMEPTWLFVPEVASSKTLRQALSEKGFEADLKAIETGCVGLGAARLQTSSASSGNSSAAQHPARHRPARDFCPQGPGKCGP